MENFGKTLLLDTNRLVIGYDFEKKFVIVRYFIIDETNYLKTRPVERGINDMRINSVVSETDSLKIS